MDFTKQCKRFLNYRVINHETLKKRFSNISALGCLKHVKKISKDNFVTSYNLVFHDNDEMCTYMVNEADGKIVAQTDKKLHVTSYGLCCSFNPTFIYLCDYNHNKIRKFDENLKEVGQLKIDNKNVRGFNGPCQITINQPLSQIQVVDQNNCRVVIFDLKTEEYKSEFNLFEEDLNHLTKPEKNTFQMDLTAKLKGDDHIQNKHVRAKLDFKPFAIYSKNERIYITDWNRGYLYVYKNNRDNVYRLERKIESSFTRPRDILLDSLDSMLIVDLDRDIFYFLDNKGTYLFQTKIPKAINAGSHFEERGAFGLVKLENKLIFASNSSIYVCKLNAIID